MTDTKRTDNIAIDCRLAAHLLQVTGTFEKGQAVLRDAASEIESMSPALADMTRQRDDLAAEVMRLLHIQTMEAIQSGIDEARPEGAKP